MGKPSRLAIAFIFSTITLSQMKVKYSEDRPDDLSGEPVLSFSGLVV